MTTTRMTMADPGVGARTRATGDLDAAAAS
jgi:hypothetical protein